MTTDDWKSPACRLGAAESRTGSRREGKPSLLSNRAHLGRIDIGPRGLAAQAAGRLDGATIRDRLRAGGGGPDRVVTAGPRGIADALRILAQGGEVDYEGASGSMDWDGNGDLRCGHISIWRFTGDERIEDVEAVPFGR